MEYIKPVIRPMENKDLNDIVEVEQKCFRIPWSKSMFEDELYNLNAHYLVAEVAGRIVGYIGFWKIIDEGHITNIAVHPDFRGLGYGRELIAAMILKAKEMELIAITLEVRKSNKAAISLYESFGFVSSGIRKKYYSDNNEDALIMWLKL
ncbi:MAG: ribosomal protein S18-alanine N-acetyltransferase [Clostridiaceae bacterium]|jgi:ribosomal-protein-alanine N-acetyltransferase|nr:ribosomal protein S18-alanine N-acetyltransferase [Clostridiaceae bacterium]